MYTKLTAHEAQILNENLKLEDWREKFYGDRWYDRHEFAKRGITSWSGKHLADILKERYGLKFKGQTSDYYKRAE